MPGNSNTTAGNKQRVKREGKKRGGIGWGLETQQNGLMTSNSKGKDRTCSKSEEYR